MQECQQIVAGKWSIDGIKVLGVYLGNETFIKTNWVQLENKVHSIKIKWSYYAKCLSYKGRILILNVLCASNLWHVFRVLQPPTDLVDRLQKCFVNFVWQGNHWTKGNILSLPNEHG